MTLARCLTTTSPGRPVAVGPVPQVLVPNGRPGWLTYTLELVDRARGPVGVVYLLHFDRPIGDPANPRGFAAHYTGTTASSGPLTAVGTTQGGEFAELSPDRAVSLDQTPSSIRSSRLQLDRPVCQGAIDDLFGAQLLPVRRPEDEVAHILGRARNVALDQVQPCLQVDRAALGTHELTDQVDQLISAQPLRHGAHDGRAGGPSPASGTGPLPGDIRRGEQRSAAQHPHLRVHASRKSPAFPDDRAGIVLSCRESPRPAQARPTGHLAWDTRREPQPYAATNCRQIQQDLGPSPPAGRPRRRHRPQSGWCPAHGGRPPGRDRLSARSSLGGHQRPGAIPETLRWRSPPLSVLPPARPRAHPPPAPHRTPRPT